MAQTTFTRRYVSSDLAVDQNFEQLETIIQEIQSSEILTSNIVKNISIGTSATQVAHGLNREPIGWIIIKKSANADVWEPSVSSSPSRLISLVSNTSVTVSIMFF